MDFSAKISHSVLLYLEHKGFEVDLTLSDESLRDPTRWLPAKDLEKLLRLLYETFQGQFLDQNFIEMAALQSAQLRGWGVLDSVLRIIEKPHDFYAQPDKLLSYFVSPAPPLANIKRAEEGIEFDLPIAWEEYPFCNQFLKSALESLPTFIGLSPAEVKWKAHRISIQWPPEQKSFVSEEIESKNMAPAFVASLIDNLQKTEQALMCKTKELEKIRGENEKAAQSNSSDLEKWFHFYRRLNLYTQKIHRLNDYFNRSQQLVTLLVAQDGQTHQVQQAMKKVDWETVQKSFPEVIEALLSELNQDKQLLNLESSYAQNTKDRSPRDSRQSWLANS